MKNNYLQEAAMTLSPDTDNPTIGADTGNDTDNPTTGGGGGGSQGGDGK